MPKSSLYGMPARYLATPPTLTDGDAVPLLVNVSGALVTVGSGSNYITYPIFAADVSKAIFIAPVALQITAATCVFGSQSVSGVLNLEKLTGTTVPGSGTVMLTDNTNLGFDLGGGVVNTVQTGTLTGTVATLQLAAGNRLGVKIGGTMTGSVGCVVTVSYVLL